MPTTLSAQQAADKLQVDKSTIYKMARQKAIPHFRIGKRVLFRDEALDDWITNQEEQNMKRSDS